MLTPYYEDSLIQLYHGDARLLAYELDPSGWPVRIHYIGDPPYTAHTHEHSRAGSRAKPLHNGTGLVSHASYNRTVGFGFSHLTGSLRHTIAEQARRLVTGWVLLFSDDEGVAAWMAANAEAGLHHVRVGHWRKLASTPQMTGDRPGVGTEAIVIAHQAGPNGKPLAKRWNGGGRHAVWEHQIVTEHGGRECGEARVHETQKPEDLICQLILDFTLLGDMILDFTAGSGTTLVCARRLKRRAIGIEKRLADCETAVKRLRGEVTGVGFTPAMRLGQQGLFQ